MIPKNPEIGRAIEAKMKEVPPQKAWFARQYELLHQAIDTGGPLPVELSDARVSLELITACYHSSETGRTVDLPIGPIHAKSSPNTDIRWNVSTIWWRERSYSTPRLWTPAMRKRA